MAKFEIKHWVSGKILFSLETESLKLCIEAAVKSGADLMGADLMGADLTGAYLTGADLTGAYITGADPTGAYPTGAYFKEIRTRRIGMEKLTEWNACEDGKKWVKENVGDSVSCADLYAHGMDNYLVWLEGRVLMMILKEKEVKS